MSSRGWGGGGEVGSERWVDCQVEGVVRGERGVDCQIEGASWGGGGGRE